MAQCLEHNGLGKIQKKREASDLVVELQQLLMVELHKDILTFLKGNRTGEEIMKHCLQASWQPHVHPTLGKRPMGQTDPSTHKPQKPREQLG